MDEPVHLPVLRDDVLELLAVRPGGLYVDGTVGFGGHAEAIVAAGGRLVGLDRDLTALASSRARLGSAAELHHATFATIPKVLAGRMADGVLLDVGVSSPQLDRAERGFSFRSDGPLDMRMDQSTGQPVGEWLDSIGEVELANVLYAFGEERQSRRIARAMLAARPLRTTKQLADLVAGLVRADGRIHPATRTFQALRIAINDELGELDRALAGVPSCLAAGGRFVVIAFHSLEDRRVKQAFRALAGDDSPRDLFGQPTQVSDFHLVERRARKGDADPNPRARSARVRAIARNP